MKKFFAGVLVGVSLLLGACGGEEKNETAKELVRNAYHTEVQDNYLAVARFYGDGMVEGEEDSGHPYGLLSSSSWQAKDILEVATKTLESSEVKENEGIEHVYVLTSRRETVEEIDKYGKETEYYIYGDIHIAKFDIEELKKVVDPRKASIWFEQGVFMTDSRAEPNKEIANKALSRFVGLGEIVSEDYLTDLEIADILENSLNKGIEVQLKASPFEEEEDSIISKLLPDSVLYDILLEIESREGISYLSINDVVAHESLVEGRTLSLTDIDWMKSMDGFYEEEIEAAEKIIERLRENKNQSLPY